MLLQNKLVKNLAQGRRKTRGKKKIHNSPICLAAEATSRC
jgi:hypothetical protein